jgi:hypothetical protein
MRPIRISGHTLVSEGCRCHVACLHCDLRCERKGSAKAKGLAWCDLGKKRARTGQEVPA